MQGFEPVTLTWAGAEYTVPADKQMMLIARIEDALTYNPATGEHDDQALSVLFRKKGPPHSRLAAALGAALRYAGAKVEDAEIYLAIQNDLANQSRDNRFMIIQSTIVALLSIISPPAAKAVTGKGDDAPKKG